MPFSFRSIKEPIVGFYDELTDSFGKKYEERIKEIEDNVEKDVFLALSQLDLEQKEELLKTIVDRRKLIDVSPAYKNEVVAISKQILAFGGAGIALGATFAKEILNLPDAVLKIGGFFIVFYFDLIILSLYTLFVFLWQSRFRYPFLYLSKVGNATPYFYYKANAPGTSYNFFQSASTKFDAINIYTDGLKKFTEYLISTISISIEQGNQQEKKININDKFLADELKQYFLLLTYQGYSNQYEIKITHLFIYGLIGSLVSTILVTFFIY
ncbi:hypothetical protein [Spirosoma pulveris]